MSLLGKLESTLSASSNTIPQKVIQICSQELDFNRNLHTYHEAAEILGKLNPNNEVAIQALKYLLENTGERKFHIRQIREEAVKSLGVIGENNEVVVQVFDGILKTTRYSSNITSAAESLGKDR